MLRLSKMTDYGILIMSHLAKHPGTALTAAEVATGIRLSPPTVRKLLKTLAREGYLNSQRGTKGGYYLAAHADDISLAELIEALEGPMALTECNQGAGSCPQAHSCPTRDHWRQINQTIRHTLSGVSLAQMNESTRNQNLPSAATTKRKPRRG